MPYLNCVGNSEAETAATPLPQLALDDKNIRKNKFSAWSVVNISNNVARELIAIHEPAGREVQYD